MRYATGFQIHSESLDTIIITSDTNGCDVFVYHAEAALAFDNPFCETLTKSKISDRVWTADLKSRCATTFLFYALVVEYNLLRVIRILSSGRPGEA